MIRKRPCKRIIYSWQVSDRLKPLDSLYKWLEKNDKNFHSKLTIASDQVTFDPVVISSEQADAYHDTLLVNDPTLHKYYHQRYDLFSLFDQGILLDAQSWYSVTPEAIARHHARKILFNVLHRHEIVIDDFFPAESYWQIEDAAFIEALNAIAGVEEILENTILIDGFCGAGGNVIQFAQIFKHVIAIDIDPVKLYLAKNNAHVYGIPSDRILYYEADYFEFMQNLARKGSLTRNNFVVYLSPPWGGPSYRESGKFFDPKFIFAERGGVEAIVQVTVGLTENLALFLPKNICRKDMKNMTKKLKFKNKTVTFEENYLGDRLKAMTLYYGDLACRNN